jgi:hypothetical protein
MIIESLDKSTFNYFKDEPAAKGNLGITHNRIVEVPSIVDKQVADSLIAYFESMAHIWGDIAFYGSFGMGLATDPGRLSDHGLPIDIFETLRNKMKSGVELIFDREVKPNTSHAQKWEVGGYASPHSDNSDFEGNPTAFEINKYVCILYLNNNYEGGTLYFPEHNIEFKPNAYSMYIFPGGVENIHGVKEITKGTRYTMLSFWDFADSEYSEERKSEWEEEFRLVRAKQAIQREEWDKGNKYA